MKQNTQKYLDDLLLWTPFKKDLCNSCQALCCSLPVEVMLSDLIRLEILDPFFSELTQKEQIANALKHPAIKRYTPSTKKYTLNQKPNGECFFLDSEKKCTEYNKRPDTCINHPKIGPRPGHCPHLKINRK